jgi:hypothetical protein
MTGCSESSGYTVVRNICRSHVFLTGQVQPLIVFGHVCKVSKALLCPSRWNKSVPTGHIFMKFCVGGLLKYVEKFKFD